jgi:nitroreductase
VLSTIGVQPDLAAAIRERRSVRRYQPRRVPPGVVRRVVAAGYDARPLHPQIGVRWYVVWQGSVLAERLGGLAGLYGLFTSAPHYVLAVSQERPGYMENLGFCMQQLILAATARGLGTCWISDLYAEDDLLDLVPDLAPDEQIVALTPLGYADDSEPARMVQQLVRWSTARQGDRKPLRELVSRDTWAIPWTPGWRAEDERLEQILELVRLAPSRANAQPWHMIVDTVARTLAVIATVDRTAHHKVPSWDSVHAGKPYYRVDGGIAMCHLDLAARSLGWPSAQDRIPSWHVLRVEQQARARARYRIPAEYDVLGVFV